MTGATAVEVDACFAATALDAGYSKGIGPPVTGATAACFAALDAGPADFPV